MDHHTGGGKRMNVREVTQAIIRATEVRPFPAGRTCDVLITGDPDMPVRRVGVLPGGGSLGLGVEQMPMQLMARRNLDVLLCGDLTEWTLPAYVRDASQMGMNRAIIVLGHERSEEPGMKFLGDWLSFLLPDLPVVFLDAGEPFCYFHKVIEKED